MAILIGFYFTKGNGTNQKSQYETGQDAINQARGINQQGSAESKRIQQELELQNDLNTP